MTEVKTRAKELLGQAIPGAVEEIASSLRDLGLSGNAADSFCALLRSPSSTAGNLVAATGIPDSKIYYALEELARSGLVEVQAGKPKRFRPVPPREIRDRLVATVDERAAARRSQAIRVASLVEPLRSGAAAPEGDIAFIVKGRANVLGRARSMVVSARREIILMASDAELLKQLDPHLLSAVGRKARVKLAVPENAPSRELARRAELRELLCDCGVLVVDGEQVLTVNSLSDGTTYAIVSTDETLVRIAREYWESPNCCVA